MYNFVVKIIPEHFAVARGLLLFPIERSEHEIDIFFAFGNEPKG